MLSAVRGDQTLMTKLVDSLPMGLVKAEDVSNTIMYLASDSAKMINGMCIGVDGGQMANLP